MAKLAANLSWLFAELPLLDRFAAAAALGFRAVEILYPYEVAASDIAAALAASGLELALINKWNGQMPMYASSALPSALFGAAAGDGAAVAMNADSKLRSTRPSPMQRRVDARGCTRCRAGVSME